MVHQKTGKLSDTQLNGGMAQERIKKKTQELYFVTHYGTPNRDVRLKPRAIQKVTSVTNLTCTSSRVPSSQTKLKCKKALSLQDLSPSVRKHLTQRRAHLCSEVKAVLPIMTENVAFTDERIKTVAFKAYCRFLINAFRKQKEQTEIKDIYLKSTTSQVSSLKLQVSTLKALLKSDEQVISNSFKEIHTLKGLLSAVQEKLSLAITEKEDIQKELDSTKDELSKEKTESLNNKNALIVARDEASAYEVQLKKEREKINKLKSDNKMLLDKVDEMSVNLKLKCEKINNLEYTVNQLHQQANAHMNVLRVAQQKIDQDERALKEVSGCLKGLKRELGDAVLREGMLRAQVNDATMKAADEAKHFETLLKERTLKLVELEAELAMAAPLPLVARMFKLASGIISVPLVVLEALNNV